MMGNLSQFRLLLHAAGSAGCLLIVGACYLLGYVPLQSSEQELAQRRDFIREFVETRPAVEARHDKLRTQVARTQSDIDRLADRIPDTAGEDRLLRNFSRLAERANARLLDFQPGAYRPHNDIQIADVRLGIRGRYTDVCRFLAGLRGSRRLQRITKVDFRVSSRAKGEYEVTIHVEVFFKPDGQQVEAQAAGARRTHSRRGTPAFRPHQEFGRV